MPEYLVTEVDVSWMKRAKCKGSTHLFYSPQEEDENPRKEDGRRERIRRAKEMCQACVVREDCLAWAIDIEDEDAILGGLTATERKPLLRERRAALKGVAPSGRVRRKVVRKKDAG